MIEFQDVTLSYNGDDVLKGVSFAAHFHEKVAIIGASGEGKTTILKLIVGLVRPDSGRILIDGKDITELPEADLRGIRRKFSIVFQEGALFDSLNVRENVAFCLRECADLPEEEIERIVRGLLRKVGIEQAIEHMPEALSGGMQRRVAIARSLAAGEPEMMLYDEPTTALDPITADNICDLINELSSGVPPDRRGLMIVTHDVPHAAQVSERFMYLSHGTIVFDGRLAVLQGTDDPGLRRFIKGILT